MKRSTYLAYTTSRKPWLMPKAWGGKPEGILASVESVQVRPRQVESAGDNLNAYGFDTLNKFAFKLHASCPIGNLLH